MKIALQLHLIPAKTTAEKTRWAADHGVEAIEVVGAGTTIDALRRDADAVLPTLPISTVCGNSTPDGRAGFDFLHPDLETRRASLDGSRAILKFCGEVGAVGQIVVPIFGPPVVPDLSPVISTLDLEERLMVAALKALGPVARRAGTQVLVEPLNRYEQHYLRRQSDGVRVLEKARAPHTALISDFFHMHIEETDTPKAIRNAGRHVRHVHLADNTRMEPGTGDIDFVAGFRALRRIGYKDYMAYECAITGDTDKARRRHLSRSLNFVRECLKKSKR